MVRCHEWLEGEHDGIQSITTSYIMPVMSLLYVYLFVGSRSLGKSGKVVGIERWEESESYVSLHLNCNSHYSTLSHRDSGQGLSQSVTT